MNLPSVESATDDLDLAARAAELRALHRPGHPLVLVNAWDAASAARVAAAGAAAIATSSAAMAESLGQPDDPTIDLRPLFDAIGRIAAAVDLPVTADVLDGYGLAAPELVERLLRAGAVGCNIEDADHSSPGSLVDPGRAADRLAAVRAAADAAGIPLVLNARTDVLRLRGPAAVDDVLDRAARYLAAGADCIYPVGLRDPEVVRTLTASLDAPVNANASDAASIAAVGAAGAARVSLGPTAFSRAYAALDLVAAELLS